MVDDNLFFLTLKNGLSSFVLAFVNGAGIFHLKTNYEIQFQNCISNIKVTTRKKECMPENTRLFNCLYVYGFFRIAQHLHSI